MTPQQFIDSWLAGDADAQNQLLASQREAFTHNEFGDAVMQALNVAAEAVLRSDLARCTKLIAAMDAVAAVSSRPTHHALAALARGNFLLVGKGSYRDALAAFDAASDQYGALNLPHRQASVAISKVVALGHLGRYAEAEPIAAWARDVLAERGDHMRLASLLINTGLILHMRRGDDARTLTLLDEAATILRTQVDPAHPYLAFIEQDRATSLRHLGRFDEAVAASQQAQAQLEAIGYAAEAMRAQQNLALTYFVTGRYNDSLRLLEEVKQFWEADGRTRDAVMIELFVSDGLLALFRYADVVEKCQAVRTRFTAQGITTEVAQAATLQARAYAGLGRYAEAATALADAARIYAEEDNQVALHLVYLEQAALQLAQGDLAKAAQTAKMAADWFSRSGHLVPEARASLVMARSAAANGDAPVFEVALARARVLATQLDIPSLLYQVDESEGDWLLRNGDVAAALAAYDTAITQIELMKGRVMVEHRVTVADNTYTVYEKATHVAIEAEQFARALQYAERAKSRVLLDLIAYRLDLRIDARQPEDQPLVDELLRLRDERDRLYRRLGGSEELRHADTNRIDAALQQVRRRVVACERQITGLWHQLLIRNADYVRDAALWQVHAESVQTHVPADALLLEFYRTDDTFIVFLVSAEAIDIVRLHTTPAQIERWLNYFHINCDRVVPNRNSTTMQAALTAQAQTILQTLYEALLRPVQHHIDRYQQLIIVPHGLLHYVPFHALQDGERYLLECHTISYLPNGSLLRHLGDTPPSTDAGFHAFGYSADRQLLFAVQEAKRTAHIMAGHFHVDDDATLATLRAVAPHARVLHLATHGEFNGDNALFSGLTLADGQLVTLDVFNLSLNASLVTLSACQTGHHIISEGEELLGLMRGFLTAGARSLVLTHWSVADEATAHLMEYFYQALHAGAAKADALRQAQQALAADGYTHPYYWAPFYLVGEFGKL